MFWEETMNLKMMKDFFGYLDWVTFRQTVIIALNLAFACLLLGFCFFKKGETKQRRLKLKFKHVVVGQLCVFMAALNALVCVWRVVTWFRRGSSLNLNLDLDVIQMAAQAYAWYVFPRYTQGKGEMHHPYLFRAWWVSLLVCFTAALVFDAFHFNKGVINQNGFWIDILSLPVCSLLVFGSFCVDSIANEEGIEEPLLKQDDHHNHAYENANLLSILSFSWLNPLLATGHKRPLQLEDLPPLSEADCAESICNKFRERLAVEEVIDARTLAKVLFLIVWKQIARSLVLSVLYSSASYVGPYIINDFVDYLNGDHGTRGFYLVSIVSASMLLESVCQRHLNFKLQMIGMHFRVALMSSIYRKGLRISSQAKQRHTSGEIINYMSVDAERVGIFGWYLNDIFSVPIQVVLALLILYKNLGWSSLAAIATTAVIMLANLPLGSLQERFHENIMEAKDKRMKATSETLKNMRILKLQAWEIRFLDKLKDLRKVECKWLKKFLALEAVVTFVYWAAPTFVSIVTFGTCLLFGVPLTAGRVLSTLATVKVLQEPIYNLPDLISYIAQTKVSLERLASFFREEELLIDTIEQVLKDKTDIAVEVIGGDFSWDASTSDDSLTLRQINISVNRGNKVAICGTVGSGKSSLLCSVLGEMTKKSGVVRVSGSKAYVSQSPWIQNGTIQENILFGKPMETARYVETLNACALTEDLELFAYGDETIIGERGINLSGGQKQRIQLARAIYQDADIYLLDDPFSAVDAQTGNHLFQECVLSLLKSKTILYVTHQMEFLPIADHVIVMRQGQIVEAGKYQDILYLGENLNELVGAHQKALDTIDDFNTNMSKKDGISETESTNTEKLTKMDGSAISEDQQSQNEQAIKEDLNKKNSQLVQEEEKETGRVGLSVYWSYITAAYKGWLVPVMMAAQVLFQILQIGGDYWISSGNPASTSKKASISSSLLIGIYVAFSLSSSMFILVRAVLLSLAAYTSANRFFNDMYSCIFRAPMSFFDSTPSGRILNRVSTDQSAVDLELPFQLGMLAFSSIRLLAIVAVMSNFAWQIFLMCLIEFGLSIWYQQYQVTTARELSRLVGICKAPVLQHFSETISGAITIRSFDQQERFSDTNLNFLDNFSRPTFNSAATMEWLCFRLDLLTIFVFTFALVFLVSLPLLLLDASIAGLGITYGLNLSSLQAWIVWCLCKVESKMISIERILQYTRIPNDGPLYIEKSKPSSEWPIEGTIQLHDLEVRYAPHLPLVLKGITCTFPGGMKVGIVGRTGSGKSTLIQALFRIIDLSRGRIIIDNIDISTIGLHDLRSKLSIIPQDPTMFEGTLRTNIDPLGDYSDLEIWQALRKCQLEELVSAKENKLDSLVTENGENWSVGQRQLVCLARTILKGSRILVLDEATASVDSITDGLIQDTLRSQFSYCTVITVAHRIPTVIESDMVLVLKDGQISEYDSPKKLLENNLSAFSRLVSEYSSRSSWSQ